MVRQHQISDRGNSLENDNASQDYLRTDRRGFARR